MRWKLFAALCVLFAALAGYPAAALEETAGPAAQGPRILYVNSYHTGYIWSDNIQKGITEVLVGTFGKKLDLRIEYLDGKHVHDELHGELGKTLEKAFRMKYSDLRFDLIIVSDLDAYEFVSGMRDEVFPKTPMLFTGVEETGRLAPMTSGILSHVNFRENLELMRRVMPRLKRIWVVTDASAMGRINRATMDAAAASMQGGPELRYFDEGEGLGELELLAKVSELGPEDAVFFLDYYSDPKGTYVDLESFLPRLCATSPVPVFSHVDLYLELGVTGGLMHSGLEQGRQLAEIGVRLVAGERIEDFPPQPERYLPMFSYPKTQRFGIALASLPEGSEILDSPKDDLSRYIGWIIGGFVFMVAEAFLIAALFVLVRKRRMLQEEAERSGERFSRLFELAPIPLVSLDSEDRVLAINKRFTMELGYGPEELSTLDAWRKLAYPDPAYREKIIRLWDIAIAKAGGTERILLPEEAFEMTCKNGRKKLFLVSSSRFEGESIISYFDITEQKKAELLALKNEEGLRSLLTVLQSEAPTNQEFLDQALAEAIKLTSSVYGYLYFYDEDKELFTLNSWSRGVMDQCSVQNPQAGYQLASTGIWGEAVRQRKPIIVNDFTIPDPLKKGYPEGHVILTSFLTLPVVFEDRIRAVIGVANKQSDYDETDVLQLSLLMDSVWKVVVRKNTAEELRKLNSELEDKVLERTKELAAANQDLLAAMDELTEAQNKMLVQEKQAALGRLVAGIAHELNTPLAAIAASNRTERLYLEQGFDAISLAVSRLRPETLALLSEARKLCAAKKDLLHADPPAERKERRRIEAMFREAGVGEAELAAEDFVDFGISELAPRALPVLTGPEAADFLTNLRAVVGTLRAARISEEATDSAARVVSALRTYVGSKSTEKPRPIRLKPELESLIGLYYNKTKRSTAISLDIGPDDAVMGREEEINRILFNIINNAVQAIGGQGHIEVRSRRIGGELEISIIDSGPGIPDEVKPHIFEPFFTTKPAGEGSGLGLDISRRLALSNCGTISFKSEPGRTEFILRLPAATPS